VSEIEDFFIVEAPLNEQKVALVVFAIKVLVKTPRPNECLVQLLFIKVLFESYLFFPPSVFTRIIYVISQIAYVMSNAFAIFLHEHRSVILFLFAGSLDAVYA